MGSTVWMPQNTEGVMHPSLPKSILRSFSYSGWIFRLWQRSKIGVYLEELFNSLEKLWKCPGLRHATSSLINVVTWGRIPMLLILISPALMIDLPRMRPLCDDSRAKASEHQLTCVPQTSTAMRGAFHRTPKLTLEHLCRVKLTKIWTLFFKHWIVCSLSLLPLASWAGCYKPVFISLLFCGFVHHCSN